MRVFEKRKAAYERLFPYENGTISGDAATVLADLKRFARLPDAPLAKDLNGQSDLLQTGILMGRQEIVNRILAQTGIDSRTLLNLREDHD